MEAIYMQNTRKRRSVSDSSSDALRTGGPGMLAIVVGGFRRASPGAVFIGVVCVVIACVGIFARV